jgi:hypothetical protein
VDRLRRLVRHRQSDAVPDRLRIALLIVRLFAAAACCIALAARAADPAILSKEIGIDPQKDVPERRVFEDVVVAPIPISNPTFGTGLAVVVMPFYYLGEDSPLSNTTVAC